MYRYPVKTPKKKLTKEKQLWLLNNHPMFTGKCSNCGYDYGNKVLDIDEKNNHWDCPECGVKYS